MITRISMVPRRIGLGSEEFQKHWHDVHGPLVCRLKGLRRSWQNHALLRDGEPLLPWTGFDACAELDFDDAAALQTAFGEHYPAELKADSNHLLDTSNAAPMVVQRVHVAGEIDLKRVRLMTFMRRAPDCTIAQLEAALRAIPVASVAHARQLYLSVESAAATAGRSGFDAIDVQWFDGPHDAEHYVTSTEAREHRHAIGRVVQGVERLIAQVRVIM